MFERCSPWAVCSVTADNITEVIESHVIEHWGNSSTIVRGRCLGARVYRRVVSHRDILGLCVCWVFFGPLLRDLRVGISFSALGGTFISGDVVELRQVEVGTANLSYTGGVIFNRTSAGYSWFTLYRVQGDDGVRG